MAQMYYLDTCIWRDFYEDRFSRSGKPFGKYANKLFLKIIKNKNKIIFSESLFWELKKDYNLDEINNMLNLLFFSDVLIRIEITKEEYVEAKILSKNRDIPFVDCLNAIHARNYNAIMVSQDSHFFKNLSDIIKPVKPQNII